MCVCACVRARAYSFSYPACNAYAPYFNVIFDPSGCSILFDIISKTARSSKKKNVIEHKMCFDFLYNFIYNNLARYCHKCEDAFMWSTRYSCQILMKLAFSTDSLGGGGGDLNNRFHQYPSSGERSWEYVLLCGLCFTFFLEQCWFFLKFK
jgi:hypothetical protein